MFPQMQHHFEIWIGTRSFHVFAGIVFVKVWLEG